MNFRLVLQRAGNYYGGDRIGWHTWYVLQVQDPPDPQWKTVPVVMWDDLPEAEQKAIVNALDPSAALDRMR